MIGTTLTPKKKGPSYVVTAAAGTAWIVQRADGVFESPRTMGIGEMAADFKVADGRTIASPSQDNPAALAIREQLGWNDLGSSFGRVADADELDRKSVV
jgi:hypothetical protein